MSIRPSATDDTTVTPPDLQAILDRWGCGRIVELRGGDHLTVAQTTRGTFIVIDTGEDLTVARRSQDAVMETLIQTVGPLQRCLLADWHGLVVPDASFVHQKDHYFAVYRLLDR
jgi:hypothetical protein